MVCFGHGAPALIGLWSIPKSVPLCMKIGDKSKSLQLVSARMERHPSPPFLSVDFALDGSGNGCYGSAPCCKRALRSAGKLTVRRVSRTAS